MADDPALGLSLRLIRQFRAEDESTPVSPTSDLALQLAAGDTRDIPFAEKLRDAIVFIKRRTH